MERKTILNALRSKFSDSEDALQYFSAVRDGKVTSILTRNIKDFKQNDIPVLSPENYLIARARR